jgi:hypothetical protein
VTEVELQRAVIQLANLGGWRVAHFRPAQTAHGWRTPVAADGMGFPDLVLAHPTRGVIFAELKAQRGKTSPEQDAWLDCLTTAGADTALWRPSDLPRIAEELTGRRVRSVA